MPFSGNGLPRGDKPSPVAMVGVADITGDGRCGGSVTVSASSFNRGARRPTDQTVAVLSHLLVA